MAEKFKRRISLGIRGALAGALLALAACGGGGGGGSTPAQIGRAHVRTPVTEKSRMPSSA